MQSNKILVLDLEATCFERTSGIKYKPEIIEVGICTLLLRTGEIVQKNSYIVKPYGQISDYCTALTGITQEKVDSGKTLKEVFELISQEYKSQRLIWSSWGDWDRGVINQECASKGAVNPFSNQHLNIKALCAMKLASDEIIGKTTGVSKTLELLGMQFEGRPHSGLDDAVNTARILYKLLT